MSLEEARSVKGMINSLRKDLEIELEHAEDSEEMRATLKMFVRAVLGVLDATTAWVVTGLPILGTFEVVNTILDVIDKEINLQQVSEE